MGVVIPAGTRLVNRRRAVRPVIDGYTFGSQGEADRYGELRLLKQAGTIAHLRVHPRYPLMIRMHDRLFDDQGRMVRAGTLVADFEYLGEGAGLVTEDVKVRGWRRSERSRLRDEVFRLKAAIFLAQYGRPIVVVER